SPQISSQASCIARPFATGRTSMSDSTNQSEITVTFRNFTINRYRWTIRDEKAGRVVFNEYLEPRNEEGDRVQLSLLSDGVLGEASYMHEGGSLTHTGQLSDGQEELMN